MQITFRYRESTGVCCVHYHTRVIVVSQLSKRKVRDEIRPVIFGQLRVHGRQREGQYLLHGLSLLPLKPTIGVLVINILLFPRHTVPVKSDQSHTAGIFEYGLVVGPWGRA